MIKKIWQRIKEFFKHEPRYTNIPPPGIPIDPKKYDDEEGFFGLGIHL